MQPERKVNEGAREGSWYMDICQRMHKVGYSAGVLKSKHLALLTGQLEQAGYGILNEHPITDALDTNGEDARFIRIARDRVPFDAGPRGRNAQSWGVRASALRVLRDPSYARDVHTTDQRNKRRSVMWDL